MQVGVCNLRSNDFKQQFIDSVLNTGFAVVTHHGIDYDLIKEAQQAWREFFQSGSANHDKFVNPTDSNLGFSSFGSEKAVGSDKADLKLFFHWKPGHAIPEEARLVTNKLYSLLEGDIAGQLLHALNGIGSSMEYDKVCRGSDNTILRALYYPALKEIEQQPGAVRAAAHADINFITLLVAASAPGLQVQDKEGNWHEVPFEDNSIICNIGDMLQLASGYKLKSTIHRVINPGNDTSDRLSIPVFVHANSNTMLAPGFTAQQYLVQRLNEIYKGGYK